MCSPSRSVRQRGGGESGVGVLVPAVLGEEHQDLRGRWPDHQHVALALELEVDSRTAHCVDRLDRRPRRLELAPLLAAAGDDHGEARHPPTAPGACGSEGFAVEIGNLSALTRPATSGQVSGAVPIRVTPAASSLSKISGDGQSGDVGSALAAAAHVETSFG